MTDKLYHQEVCSTDPHDRISIRAAGNVEMVMLTATGSGHVLAIDLTPDQAWRFASTLQEAANLAKKGHR